MVGGWLGGCMVEILVCVSDRMGIISMISMRRSSLLFGGGMSGRLVMMD